MENPFYIATDTANRLLEKQMTTSNNIANMSTIGFKNKYLLLISENNGTNSLKKNEILLTFKPYYDASEGSFIYTKQPLDLIIKNNGWFIVRKKDDEKEYYTRNGHLNINSKGYLNIQGRLVIGEKGLIKVPKNNTIQIMNNGDIFTVAQINKKTSKQKISKFKIAKININNMLQDNKGMFYIKNKLLKYNIRYEKNNIEIKSGILENSNVNPSSSMIQLISDSRLFEMNMKVISNYDQMIQQANKILNVNN